MHKNPFFNAIIAAAYIWGIVLLVHFIAPPPNTPDTPLTMVVVLSLMVFSAAFMGYTFFYKPVALMIDTKKEEAASYFLTTLGMFGAISLITILAISTFGVL